MKWAVASVLVLLISLSASAGDLEIVMGRPVPTALEGEVKQFISVKNNGSQTTTAMVECGFLTADGDVVDTGSAFVLNLKPGKTGYTDITSSGAFDHAECRISLATPAASQ
jgi:hypothetical protein